MMARDEEMIERCAMIDMDEDDECSGGRAGSSLFQADYSQLAEIRQV